MTNTLDYLAIAKEITNRFMKYLNIHPGVQIRTKEEWCASPMIGIELAPDFAPGLASFIERRVNPPPPVPAPPVGDTFDDDAAPAEATVTPEVKPAEATDTKEPPTAYQILEFMADKAVRLNQVASRFNVSADDIKEVVKQQNSGISIGAGGWMQVAVD